MCVILLVEDGKFPKKALLKNAEMMNGDGGSIAWIENNRLHYKKGINANKVNKIIKNKLKPNNVKTAIIHFRIASVGEVKKSLCHPFPISKSVKLDLDGDNLTDDLLFHNGTITDWQDYLIDALQRYNIKMIKGDLSDSRVFARLVKLYGDTILNQNLAGNKFAILTKDGIKKYGSWVNVESIVCSNNYFEATDAYPFGNYSFYDEDKDLYSTLDKSDDDDDSICDDDGYKPIYDDYGFRVKDDKYGDNKFKSSISDKYENSEGHINKLRKLGKKYESYEDKIASEEISFNEHDQAIYNELQGYLKTDADRTIYENLKDDLIDDEILGYLYEGYNLEMIQELMREYK